MPFYYKKQKQINVFPDGKAPGIDKASGDLLIAICPSVSKLMIQGTVSGEPEPNDWGESIANPPTKRATPQSAEITDQ